MRPLAFLLGMSLALSGLNVRGEPTPYLAKLQDAPMRATAEGVKAAVHQVILYEVNAACTAVARSASVLMFAEHCLRGEEISGLLASGRALKVERIARDGNDHVLVRVEGAPFAAWATMATDRPKQGEWVFLYGSPGEFGDLLRFGSFAGAEYDWLLYDLRTAPGDSGGAIFNAKGEVLDLVYGSPRSFPQMTLCYPIQFARSQEQWVGL